MTTVVANARGKPGNSGPFCWQSIHILRHLREVCESSDRVSVSAAQSVYLAVTELSTDHRSASFQTPISEVAKRAGLGTRTTGVALAILREIGFLHVQPNYVGSGEIRASNTYTLLKHDTALCKFCAAHGNSGPLAHPLILLEDKEEEKREALFSSSVLPAWIDKACREFPMRTDIPLIAEKFTRFYAQKPNAMCYERLVDWIRKERQPQNERQQTLPAAEPHGWQTYFRQKYPLLEFPDREIYEDGPWTAVPDYLKKIVTEALKKQSA